MISENRKFTMIEMMTVIFVIMILMTLGTIAIMKIQERVRVNGQLVELLNIKNSIGAFKISARENKVGSQLKLSIGDMMEKESTLDVKREPFEDRKKPDAFFLSVFGTKISVEVAKVSVLKKEEDILPLFKSITGHEYLTKDFEFYFGNHEEDGGEAGTKFGLKGEVGINRYWYRLKFKTSDEPDAPEFEKIITM